MISLLMGALTSLGLGTLTLIHPCPLSTNIAAVSFLFGLEQKSNRKMITVFLFVLGESVTFVLLGSLVAFGIFNISPAANFLQEYIRQLFGPILVLSGMLLLGILLPKQSTLKVSKHLLPIVSKLGEMGGFFLGIFVALAFCPMSAAIYFGVLIPLAISNHMIVLYPVLFALGAGFPILLIVFLGPKGACLLHRSYLLNKSTENTLRMIASTIMILVGIIMSLKYIFKVL